MFLSTPRSSQLISFAFVAASVAAVDGEEVADDEPEDELDDEELQPARATAIVEAARHKAITALILCFFILNIPFSR